MDELYELLLEKAKKQVESEASLSADTHKLISTILKVYHATHRAQTNSVLENKESQTIEKTNKQPREYDPVTDEELLETKTVTPELAAKYLQNGTTAQDLRLDAQEGICPFMTAKRCKGGRHSYRVNVGLLIRYKNGELGLI